MKTFAFAIIAAAAIMKGEANVALYAFIATCVEAIFDDSLRIVFNNNVKVNNETEGAE